MPFCGLPARDSCRERAPEARTAVVMGVCRRAERALSGLEAGGFEVLAVPDWISLSAVAQDWDGPIAVIAIPAACCGGEPDRATAGMIDQILALRPEARLLRLPGRPRAAVGAAGS